MPIRSGWLWEPHIYLVQFKGNVTDAEYTEAGSIPHMLATLEQSDSPMVHVVNEVVDDHTTLPSIQAIVQTPLAKHPKLGWAFTMNVSHNPIWRMVVSIAGQVLRIRVRDVSSYEEAIAWAQHMDATIPGGATPQVRWFSHVNWEPDDPETVPHPP